MTLMITIIKFIAVFYVYEFFLISAWKEKKELYEM